jgi:alkanesulfonate monooxygenase SsuD/methylene tetrahydromethanopterin reductase-like flavin-dependent oxidoreductase (luciferase family)
MVDVYNRSLVLQGFGGQAAAITEAWTAGERDRAAEAIDDGMLAELMVFGDLEQCRSRIEAFRDAGVKTPILLPVSVAGDPAERSERVRESITALAGT